MQTNVREDLALGTAWAGRQQVQALSQPANKRRRCASRTFPSKQKGSTTLVDLGRSSHSWHCVVEKPSRYHRRKRHLLSLAASRRGRSYSGAATQVAPSANEMHSAGIQSQREVSGDVGVENEGNWHPTHQERGPGLDSLKEGQFLSLGLTLLQQQHFSSSNQQRFHFDVVAPFQSPVVDHARNPRQRSATRRLIFHFRCFLLQVLQASRDPIRDALLISC